MSVQIAQRWKTLALLAFAVLLNACGDDEDDNDLDLNKEGTIPTITSFSATPNSVAFGGGEVILAYAVSNATSLSIDQGVGDVTGTAQKTVNVTTTTTFTLTATNATGTTTQPVTVTVLARVRGNAMFVLTTDNHLRTVDENTPGLADADVALTGLVAGDTLYAIDVRPLNGRLYGLASDGTNGRIYHIDVRDGTATPLGAPFKYALADGTSVPVSGTDLDMDFNPAVDRIRIVTSGGLNARANPNSGGAVDGDLGGTAGTVANVNSDGSTSAALGGAAYTNSTVNVAATTLYTVTADGTSLAIQNPPNVGTQVSVGPITVSGTTIAAGTRVAFDIPKGVDTATSNVAVTSGNGYLAVVRDSGAELYRVNLTNAQATSLGGLGANVRDVALWTPTAVGIAQTEPTGTPVLSRFVLDAPGTVTTVNITGFDASETFAGLTLRPATGQVLGLGYNATTDAATLYVVDPQTGAATRIGSTTGVISFVTGTGTAIQLDELHIAMNNTADRVRVISATGANFRVNPNDGLPVDGSTTDTGINPDGFIGAPANGGDAVAYVDRSPTADLFVTVTSATDTVYTSETPNTGVVTALGALGVDVAGFTALADGAAGAFYGAFQVGGVTSLYTVSTTAGAATSVGRIGTGANPVRSLVTVVPASGAAMLTRP